MNVEMNITTAEEEEEGGWNIIKATYSMKTRNLNKKKRESIEKNTALIKPLV